MGSAGIIVALTAALACALLLLRPRRPGQERV